MAAVKGASSAYEGALGGGSAGGGSGRMFPLVDAMSRIEGRLELLSDQGLEALRVKVQQVRVDMEAVSKEKGRAATSMEQRAIDAAASVEDLIEGVKRVDGVAMDLPALLLRMKTLEATHRAAVSYNHRFDLMEKGVEETVGQVKENGEVLKTLRES